MISLPIRILDLLPIRIKILIAYCNLSPMHYKSVNRTLGLAYIVAVTISVESFHFFGFGVEFTT